MAGVPELERRARIYSALGDPLRLAIADLLTLADAAPGDLSRSLGIASNLMAHHLRVLDEAGVIARARSEGDQRRSYVRLRLDDPIVGALGLGEVDAMMSATKAAPSITGLEPVPRVVFVCTHNSARSQLAAAVWRGLSSTPAASAGTHPARRVHPRAIAVGRRHGLRLTGAAPLRTRDVLKKHDLVVAVCDNAHEELGTAQAPGTAPRLHWSVPDPVRIDTDAAFEAAYQDIAVRVDRLARAVTHNQSRPGNLGGPPRPPQSISRGAGHDRNP